MKTCLSILILIFFTSCTSKEKLCTISGKIIGQKTDTLVLFKASKFPHIETEIPVADNAFKYMLQYQYPEVFMLTFKEDFYRGSMILTSFFAEEGNVSIEILKGGQFKDNTVTGISLNDELNNFNKMEKELFWDKIMKYSDTIILMNKNGTQLSEEANILYAKLRKAANDSVRAILYNEQRYLENTGRLYTPEAKRIRGIQDSIMNRLKLWEFNYIEQNTSLLAFYKFMENIKETAKSCCWQPVDIELTNKAQSNLDRFSKAFPGHPYNQIVQNTINGLLNIHSGGRFIDFSLPDVNGQNVTLSKVIKENKLTLLDFWSTWCGPCLRTSKDLIPIYDQYKSIGFEIVGITQSYGNRDSIPNFIKRQHYPWRNVIDIDNKNGLWDKYNLSQQGGGVFLINASGQIIAVNLTADKVKEKLDEILK